MHPISKPFSPRCQRAFTLLELLIVIAIIGALAAVGIPAMKGLGETSLATAGTRQIMDDLSLARLLAIKNRTTVYMVFVPPTNIMFRFQGETETKVLQQLTNLVSGQYRGYALMAKRTIGDQPGQENPKYLSEWRELPDGLVFAPHLYDPLLKNSPDLYSRALPVTYFNFPTGKGRITFLPYIGFNAQGQLVTSREEDLLIGFARGSLILPKNDRGEYLNEAPELVLTPRGPAKRPPEDVQYIRINWLTGRAELEPPMPKS